MIGARREARGEDMICLTRGGGVGIVGKIDHDNVRYRCLFLAAIFRFQRAMLSLTAFRISCVDPR